MERTRVGGALPQACRPTGRGVGKTSVPCGDQTGSPHAPQRTGETANHHRSDAAGGHCPCPRRASGGRVAQRGLGTAGRADHALCGPRARRVAPREAGARENPLPHHPDRAPGRPHRRSSPTVWLEGLRHQCGPHAAVFAGGGGGLSYEYRVERIFQRLKSRVQIAPLFVKLNEQIEGLTYLLTLGVRVLTVTEFVLRRSLETAQASLPGLHPENKQKRTAKPTAERILQAFSDVSLTIIKQAAGEEILRRLTPLSAVQEDILQRLGLGAALYRQLEIQEMGN